MGFWAEQVGSEEAKMAIEEMEGYDEVMQKLLEMLPPAQRLAGLLPEQRLAGLTTEEALLALPDAALRGLSEEYLGTLSPGNAGHHSRAPRQVSGAWSSAAPSRESL